MTTFKERVQKVMEKDRWVCTPQENLIDLECKRGKYIIALRIKRHGRIYDAEWKQLRNYGKNNNQHVLYAHQNSERGLSFARIYPIFKPNKE